MLTVKESLADSGRSSKTSGSTTRRGKEREEREEVQQQLVVAGSPSDLLQDTAVSLAQSQSQPQHQFGSFYLRLGTVSKSPHPPG